jgi:hypothetical protein
LATISESIKVIDPPTDENDRPRSKGASKVPAVAKKCHDAARDLQEEIALLTRKAKEGHLVSTLKVVIKTKWRRTRLNNLDQKLDDAQRAMDTAFLAKLVSRLDDTGINDQLSGMRSQMDGMAADLKYFLERFQSGHRGTNLVNGGHLGDKRQIDVATRSTHAHISGEAQRSAKSIIDHVEKSMDALPIRLREDAAAKQIRERFLKSLKFEGVSERRNAVDEAYSATLKWIFHAKHDEAPDSTEATPTEATPTEATPTEATRQRQPRQRQPRQRQPRQR